MGNETDRSDILGESWVFQGLIAQGKKEDLLQFVEIRFPTLLAQAKQAVEQQLSVKQLGMMLNKLYRANTVEEAEAALLANG